MTFIKGFIRIEAIHRASSPNFSIDVVIGMLIDIKNHRSGNFYDDFRKVPAYDGFLVQEEGVI
jgi:hypothetical protein